MSTKKLGIDTLVSISIDSILVVHDVQETQKDGFQLFPDLSTIAFKDFARIQNVAANAAQAWSEIQDLDPQELAEYEVRVAEGAKLPNTGTVGKVRGALRIAARTYALGVEAYNIFEDAKDLFAKAA